MDIHMLIVLAHQFLPADVVQKGLAVIGALSLAGQIAQRLLAWGIPAAIRAADAVARFCLATPFRPLILWQAPAIVKFLDQFGDALEQVANTFKTRLEGDIKEAAALQQASGGSGPVAHT